MKICYIKQSKVGTTLFEKVIHRIKIIFNIIDIKYDNNLIFYNIPISKNKGSYQIKRVAKKVNDKLYNNDILNIVLSEYLETIDLLKMELYSQNINILDGRKLFNYLIEETIDYILEIQNKSAKVTYISILINDVNDINTQNIIQLAKKVKLINIVTNNISKFRKIEEYLYNEYGIMIKISNNKKKDLIKSEIIVNVDYPQELLDKYVINNKAIIINVNENISIKSKKFDGISINFFELDIPNEKKVIGFRDEIIYESLLLGEFDFEKKTIKNDKVKIKKLLGINGFIDKIEFINLLDKL